MFKMEKEINEYLENWLHNNDFDCSVRMGTDFSFWTDEDVIQYALVITDHHMNLFEKVVEELGINYICDNFILSFFHELGHFETIWEIDDDVYEESQRRKLNLESRSVYTDADYVEYYHLPEEIVATEWAVNYINNNPNKIAEFWGGLQPLLLTFYTVNQIE